MKVVLVNPPSPPGLRVSRGLMGGFGMVVHPQLLYPPIELAHAAAVLEEDGFAVAIHDGDAQPVVVGAPVGPEATLGALRAAVAAELPGLVVLDSSSSSLDSDLELARGLRRALGVPVAMLGSQVTYAPSEIFEGPGVDVVVRGEPELTLLELAQRVREGRGLEGLAGTSWRNAAGEVVHEPDRELLADLDRLPLPARHLLHNDLYRLPDLDGPVTTVKSSRGCPIDCSFCGYTLAQGLRFRFRSPEHVLAELIDLRRTHGLRQVIFRDPIFTTRKERVTAICEGLLEEGLDLAWQCETAIKTLDRELLETMARAGCTHVSLGLESGNAEIQRRHCGSKVLDHELAVRVFRDCREAGIETRAFCMIGFPEETPAMVEQTLALLERCDPDQAQFCAVTAYPGTPLDRMVSGDRRLDYAAMTGFHALADGEHMSAREVEAKIREAYRRFYLRPRRLLRELRRPLRLARKVRRYFTLFERPAARASGGAAAPLP